MKYTRPMTKLEKFERRLYDIEKGRACRKPLTYIRRMQKEAIKLYMDNKEIRDVYKFDYYNGYIKR